MHALQGFYALFKFAIGLGFKRFEKTLGKASAVHALVVCIQSGLEVGHAGPDEARNEIGRLIVNAELGHGGHFDVRHNRFGVHQNAVAIEDDAMTQDAAPENPNAPASAGDLTRIARFGPEASALFAAIHAEAFDNAWPDADFGRLLASSGVAGLILEAGATPAGLALIRSVAGESEILTIGVAASHRRRGFARRLLAAVQEEARRAGSTRVFLEVSEANAPAIALYRGAGFVQAGRRRAYYRDGRDALIMALTL